LNIIAQLCQQIRVLKANQRIRRSRRAKRLRTNSHPADQDPTKSSATVPNNAEEPTAVPSTGEQQQTFVRVKQEWPAEKQTVVPSTEGQQQTFIHVKKEKEKKEVQIEAPPSGVIQVLNSKQRNKKVQVKLPAATALWKRDPKTRTLHKMMKQAQQEAEQLREQTIPREKYEELQ